MHFENLPELIKHSYDGEDDPSRLLLAAGSVQHATAAAEAKKVFEKNNYVTARKFAPEKDSGWRDQPSTKLIHFMRHGQG